MFINKQNINIMANILRETFHTNHIFLYYVEAWKSLNI